MLIFIPKLQQLHIALHSVSNHHRTVRSKLSVGSKMDLNAYIQLIFLSVVNIIFTFSGIVSNILVISCFWKSSQLRKKLCHFMVMVLSCFHFVTVITTNPGILLYLIFWLREDYDLLRKMKMYLHISDAFLGFSFCVLLVMSIEGYLGAYYPIFHRTRVNRCRLLTFLVILLIPLGVFYIISRNFMLVIFMSLLIPPFIFTNVKLFIFVRKVHRERAVSPEKKTTVNLKSISMGLWIVACLMLFSIPIYMSVYIVFNVAKDSTNTIRFSFICILTSATMNCTLNSLIFFWKNKVLRTEGIKILKTLKDRLIRC